MHRTMILLSSILVACSNPPAIELTRDIKQLEQSAIPEEQQHEAPAWRQYGIISSKTVSPPSGVTHRITLLASSGDTIGTIDITARPSELEFTRRIVTTIGDKTLILDTGDTASMRLRDPATKREGVKRFDHNAKAFSASPMLDKLADEFAGFVPITFGALSALDTEALKKSPELIETPNNTTSSALGLACFGRWYRGGALWGQQSGCCVLARSDVARHCTNQWCLGCCAHLECDVWCGKGNYGCLCGMSGRACSIH